MSQQYSDPTRASEPHALPDVEVFYLSHAEAMQANRDNGRDDSDNENWLIAGWYWWPCFPGCLSFNPGANRTITPRRSPVRTRRVRPTGAICRR